MALSKQQRRSEQLWWCSDLIGDLILEKRPKFFKKHPNVDLKTYDPEILSVFNDIADKIIETVEGGKDARKT